MSSLFRTSLFVGGFACALGTGYWLQSTPQVAKPQFPPQVVVNLPAKQATTSELKLPELSAKADTSDLAVDRSSLEYKMVEKHLGINTGSIASDPGVTQADRREPAILVPPMPTVASPTELTIPTPVPMNIVAQSTDPQPVPALSKPELEVPHLRIAVAHAEPPTVEAIPAPPAIENPLFKEPRELRPMVGNEIGVAKEKQSNEPPAPRIACLNSRSVALDFEVSKVGVSKIKAVELWATRDHGKTWALYDRMIGDKPPFKTYLTGEGEIGFTMVFESESGKRSTQPVSYSKAGDSYTRPDFTIDLDITSPFVTMQTPRQGSSGKISLTWEMSDKNRDPRSSRLSYSLDGTRWMEIPGVSKDLTFSEAIPLPGRNDSRHICRYDWEVPPGLPHQLMFRVTARDKAGNEASAELPGKVSVDLVTPEGRLTGLHKPPRPEGEVGPMPRIVESLRLQELHLLLHIIPLMMNGLYVEQSGTEPWDLGCIDPTQW